MTLQKEFWQGKRVFVTGHTGFKGAWLSLWLQQLGAQVTGYALQPPTTPNLFDWAHVAEGMTSIEGDIRDLTQLVEAVREADPEIVIHMAAQPLVRESYKNPVETYATNVMGTVNLMEAVRQASSVRVVVNVTTDKCYSFQDWPWGYRESDPLGGYEPYSASKACSEIVTASYRNAFLNEAGVAVATARAGNVIGGGDWAEDRLIPDVIMGLVEKRPVMIRYPQAIRPWQFVLEPLSGYLVLAQALWEQGQEAAGAWNFGPADEDMCPVGQVVQQIQAAWGDTGLIEYAQGTQLHEAHVLRLDASKARTQLAWQPKLPLSEALTWTAEWYRAWSEGQSMREWTVQQIQAYESRWSTQEREGALLV